MPFGLKSFGVTFMRLMDDILRLSQKSFMVLYLEDIVIFIKSWEDHLQHI